MRPKQSAVLLAILGSLFAAQAFPAVALWDPAGIPIATGPDKQRAPECWPDGYGGVLVAWVEHREGRLHDIRVQRLTRDGLPAPGWPEGGIRRQGAWGFDTPPDVYWSGAGGTAAPAADGGVYVAWRDRSLLDPGASEDDALLSIVRYDASGAVASGWPQEGILLSNTSVTNGDPVLLPDGSGGVFASWVLDASGLGETRVDHILADGTRPAGWTENGVRTTRTTLPWHQDMPVVLSDGGAGIYVGWRTSSVGHSFGLNHILADGTTASDWPDAGVDLGAGQCQDLRLVAGPGGDVYGAWTEVLIRPVSIPWRARAVRISGQGAVRSGWPADGIVISKSVYGSYNTHAIPDGAGGLFVLWQNLTAPFSFDVRVQRLDPEGRFVFPAEAIPTGQSELGTDFVQALPDGRGGLIASWAATRSTNNGHDLFARNISASGDLSYAPTRHGRAIGTGRDEVTPHIASDGAGGIFATWTDIGFDLLGDVFVQWVPAESFLPPVFSDGVGAWLSLPYPTPSVGGAATVRFVLSRSQPVEAAVLDTRGARLRTLVPRQEFPAGVTPITWNGRDDRGRAVPPGIYFLDARAGDSRASRRIVWSP